MKKLTLFLQTNFILLIFIFKLPQPVQAYIPPLESLLRHAHNKPLQKQSIHLSFLIKDLKTDQVTGHSASPEENKASPDAENAMSGAKGVYFSKWQFIRQETDTGEDYHLWMKLYLGEKEDPAKLIEALYIPEFQLKLFQNTNHKIFNGHQSGEFFHALLTSVFLNNEKLMSWVLKKTNQDYELNKEIINQDKMKQLLKYRDSLIQAKNREKSGPMVQKEEERLLNQTFFSPPFLSRHRPKLIKDGDDYAWKFSLQKSHLIFNTRTHQLMSLQFNQHLENSISDTSLECYDYQSFRGEYLAPRFILLQYGTRPISDALSPLPHSYLLEVKELVHGDFRPAKFEEDLNKSREFLNGKKKEDKVERHSLHFLHLPIPVGQNE